MTLERNQRVVCTLGRTKKGTVKYAKGTVVGFSEQGSWIIVHLDNQRAGSALKNFKPYNVRPLTHAEDEEEAEKDKNQKHSAELSFPKVQESRVAVAAHKVLNARAEELGPAMCQLRKALYDYEILELVRAKGK